jgi:F420H(2)-dependent quinone reductase
MVMAYLKPQAFTRHVVNPLVSRLQTGGVATLTVPGRRTRRARTVPVIPVEVEGIRYLVSPYGESDWVRNLRAAGKATLAPQGQGGDLPGERDSGPGPGSHYRGLPEGLRTRRGPVFHQTARSQRPSGVSRG